MTSIPIKMLIVKKFKEILIIITALLMNAGCQSTSTKNTQRLDSQVVDVNVQTLKVERGTLLIGERVKVSQNQLGTISSMNDETARVSRAAMGLGAATATTGMLTNNSQVTAIGAGVGAVGILGHLRAKKDREKLIDAYRYTIELDPMKIIVEVVQIDSQPLMPGSNVFVRYMSDGRSQVSLDTSL